MLAASLFWIASAQGVYLIVAASNQKGPGENWAPLIVALGTALAAIVSTFFAGLASLRAGKAHDAAGKAYSEAGKAHDTAKEIKADLVIPSEPGVAIGTAVEHVKQSQSAMVDVVAQNTEAVGELRRTSPAMDRRKAHVDTAPPADAGTAPIGSLPPEVS